MSTPSKARRKRREWMRKQYDQRVMEVERLQHTHQENLKALRRELTRMIPRDDEGIYYPSGKITQPYIRVAARMDGGDYYEPWRLERMAYARVEEFSLKAEQFALVLPDGTRVVWWGWRLA